MWQQVIVYCIVVVAVLHMGSRYLPAAWRRRMTDQLARRWPAAGAWLAARKAGCGGGCSSCGSCDSAAPSAPPDAGAKRVITLRRR